MDGLRIHPGYFDYKAAQDDSKMYVNKRVRAYQIASCVGGIQGIQPKGVHPCRWEGRPGESNMGMMIRTKVTMGIGSDPKLWARQNLAALREMPKPNLVGI